MSNKVGYPDTLNRKGSKQGPFLIKMVPETVETNYNPNPEAAKAIGEAVGKAAGGGDKPSGVNYKENPKSKSKESGPDKKQVKKIERRLKKGGRKTARSIKKLERKSARVDKKEKRLMEKSAKFEDKAQKKADKAKALRAKQTKGKSKPDARLQKMIDQTTKPWDKKKKSSKPKMNYNIDTSGKPKVKTASTKTKKKAPLAKTEYDRYKKTTTVETDNPTVGEGVKVIYDGVKGLLRPDKDKQKKRQEARATRKKERQIKRATKKYGDKGKEIVDAKIARKKERQTTRKNKATTKGENKLKRLNRRKPKNNNNNSSTVKDKGDLVGGV